MAESKKPTIKDSVNYKIGGKVYSAEEVTRLQPSQTGKAKTGSEISRESVSKVQTQTADYQKTGAYDSPAPSVQSQAQRTPRTVEAVKTEASPTPGSVGSPSYRPQAQQAASVPGRASSPQTTPGVQTAPSGGMKTGSSITQESISKVQTQTADYQKAGAYDSPAPSVQSQAQRTPRTVEAVKTEASPTPGSVGSPSYRPQAQQAASVPGRASSPQTTPGVQTAPSGGMKTGSSITQESISKVQTQTADYQKAGAYDSPAPSIQSQAQRTPRTVEAVKTEASPTPGSVGSPSYRPQAQQAASVPGRASSPQTTPGVQTAPSGGMKTGSSITQESISKVQTQTADYQKAGAYDSPAPSVQSQAQRTPRTVEAVKTEASPTPGSVGSPSYRPQAQGGAGYKPQVGMVAPSKGSPSYVPTGNVQTQTTISGQAVQNVQTQTAAYQKTGAYNTPAPSIQSKANKIPVNVSGVQTGSVRSTHDAGTSFFAAVQSTRNRHIALPTEKQKGVGAKGNSETKLDLMMVAGKAQSALSAQNDFGTQSAGMAIQGGMVGVQSFVLSQKAVQVAPTVFSSTARGIQNIGKGMYQVGVTGGLAVVAVNRTAAFIQAGQFHAISHQSLQMLRAQARAVGLNKTALSQGIVHAVNGIQTRVHSGIQTLKQTGIQTAAFAKRTAQSGVRVAKGGVKIVRGFANGTITVSIAGKTIARYTNKAIKTGVKTGIRTAKTVIVQGVTKGVPFIVPKMIKGMKGVGKYGINPLVGIMQSSEDWTISGMGTMISSAEMGVKTAVVGGKVAGKTIQTAVKGGLKTGKTTFAAAKFIKNNGLRAAWKLGQRKTRQAAVKAGKSVITALLNAVKAAGRKVIVPLILIAVAVMAINGVLTVPVSAVASIFSSMFSTRDTNTDYDVREYLNTIVPGLSADFQQNLADQMNASWSSYNIVRFYSNTGSTDVVEPTLAGVASVFPTNDEILNMIQPIFNAVILMNYELEPTEAESQVLTEELFSKLFTVTTVNSIEYCGQDLITGEGTPKLPHSCGSIHALDDCPNKVTGTHSSYTCDECCYYYCPGHDWYDDETGDSGTDYCGGCRHDCSGYTYCGSHSVISYTLSVDGIYRLEAEYFLDPIEELSNNPSRTEAEEAKLQELKDYYEIFQEMMSQVSINYGGGLTMADLSGVVFIDGTRTSCQAVIDLALTQVGQSGGQPYWSYYGFSSRVEWCACFVHWCMRHTPSATGSYPSTSNNAYCQTVANNFMSIGQWGDRSYTNLVAGDTIFFDWQGDGHTDHIGLVIGTDGTNVYTVEGNSGDAVKVKSYPIGSSVIYGYGLMNY